MKSLRRFHTILLHSYFRKKSFEFLFVILIPPLPPLKKLPQMVLESELYQLYHWPVNHFL